MLLSWLRRGECSLYEMILKVLGETDGLKSLYINCGILFVYENLTK